MTNLTQHAGAALRRARRRLKRFAYSGFGRDRWQQPDRILRALGVQAGERVADIGAGGGYFTFRLARAVGPTGVVYSVDTDPDMVAIIAEEAASLGADHVKTVEARSEDPGLPEPVDLIFLSNAYHHIPDARRYFSALARHVRAGGRVAVVEARPTGLLGFFGHATAPEDIRRTFAGAGYALRDQHDFLARQSFHVFEAPAR